jgi:G:T-mismatch repair DNA endonuclease (very short patch repair protein)
MAKKKQKIKKLFKKMKGTSKLEVAFSELLTNLNVKHEQHFVFKKREYDFLLTEHNILVETHGCFFHCCKEHSPEPKYAFQRANLKNDQYKVKLVKFDPVYTLLVIWEHEMDNITPLNEKITTFIGKHSKLLNG